MTAHTVYSFRSAEGDQLYVGCTADLEQRVKGHAGTQPWWHEVAHIDVIGVFPDRPSALGAEADRIRRLRPRYNVMHNDPDGPVLPEYLAGATLREIAEARGITHQAVSSRLSTEAPAWLLRLEKRRRRARTNMRAAAAKHRRWVEDARLCPTCGEVVPCDQRRGMATCQGSCTTIYRALHQSLPGHWRMETLSGKGRWFTEGSPPLHAAREAYDRGLPIFDELHEDLQRQVRGEARSWENDREQVDPHPCEGCAKQTTKTYFCSLGCYRASGRVGREARVAA